MSKRIRIAVDGYSSCGKSTFAKMIAKELGYLYIDTGAMYRAIALAMLEDGITDPTQLNAEQQRAVLERHTIGFSSKASDQLPVITLDGEEVEDRIRKPEVAAIVSQVAALPLVRESLVRLQQALGKQGGVVMDGRDIGTVVFPDAELKLFMVADPTVRAQRRYKEMQAKGIEITPEEVLANLIERDRIDTTRAASPMVKAEDAIELDNTHWTLNEQMEHLRPILAQRIG